MKKTRLLFAAAIVAACAMASAAFAIPPPTAQEVRGFDRIELAKVVNIDVQPVAIADTGSGAQSALKAYAAKRATFTLPAPSVITAPALGLDARQAASAWARPERGSGLTPAVYQPGLSIPRYRT